MKLFNEQKEVKEQAVKEVGSKTKAFENATKEIGGPRHISTINERLEGQRLEGTNVEYRKNEFRLNGEKVEGVFPVFESKFDLCLPKHLWQASDVEQFKYCTGKLKQWIEQDSEFAKKFTPRQLQEIKDNAPKISGLTWHHYEKPGRMQLVNSEIHEKCRHTGGRSIWGGGSGGR